MCDSKKSTDSNIRNFSKECSISDFIYVLIEDNMIIDSIRNFINISCHNNYNFKSTIEDIVLGRNNSGLTGEINKWFSKNEYKFLFLENDHSVGNIYSIRGDQEHHKYMLSETSKLRNTVFVSMIIYSGSGRGNILNGSIGVENKNDISKEEFRWIVGSCADLFQIENKVISGED